MSPKSCVQQGERRAATVLSRLFSSNVIKELAATGRSETATQLLAECGCPSQFASDISLSVFFDALSDLLHKHYRCEYIYKNALANKILLGRHSLTTAHMLTELGVPDSKADVVIVNGTSNVYEVKSEYDNLARLRQQLQHYSRVFDRIYVVTSPSQKREVVEGTSNRIGVVVYTKRNTLSTAREAESHRSSVDPECVFDVLRNGERHQLLMQHFGEVPDVPNTQRYTAWKELFKQLTSEEAHDGMVLALRQRGADESLRSFIRAVPVSLKAVAVADQLSWQERALFSELLKQEARSTLLEC